MKSLENTRFEDFEIWRAPCASQKRFFPVMGTLVVSALILLHFVLAGVVNLHMHEKFKKIQEIQYSKKSGARSTQQKQCRDVKGKGRKRKGYQKSSEM